MKVLVTGASGNVGRAVVRALAARGAEPHVAGRTPPTAGPLKDLPWHLLDLERGLGLGLGEAFDALFLVRPPQLADPRPFEALLRQTSLRTRVVFLSVQGAGGRPWLPHAKIEKAIRRLGFGAHFVRPAYFMENLTTTLAGELRKHGRIYLPAGDVPFNWTAIEDIAAVAARLLLEGGPQAVELTGPSAVGFDKAIEIVNSLVGTRWRYQSPGAFSFVRYCRSAGQPWVYVLVQLMLHWLPKFVGQDPLTHEFEALMGRPPLSLGEWVEKNRQELQALAATS